MPWRGDGPLPATLGPARLEDEVVAPVGKTRLEFHRPPPAQPEGLLQLQIHADMPVTDPSPIVPGSVIVFSTFLQMASPTKSILPCFR